MSDLERQENGPPEQEIERKFLIESCPEKLNQYPHALIVEGYLSFGRGEAEVRLRQKDKHFLKTVKKGSGKVRIESEIEITKEQFDSLWPKTEGKRIEKTRYEIPYQGQRIELDLYHGNLTGLIIAEVEFASEALSNEFIAPSWFSEEVTDDRRYQNQNLAVYGMPQVF